MRTRIPAATLFSIVLVLLLGFLAGCGGDQSGSGESQGGGQQGGGEQGGGEQGAKQGSKAADEGPSQAKVSLGTIESVQPDKRKLVLKPSFEAQGGDQITFNVRKNAEIQVKDQPAELSELQSGQQAQVEYVTKNDVNRAVSVQVVGD
ncbi:MAG: hypothetical protein ACJ73W_04820 [Rubrobacteraceae bacterium]